MRSLYRLCLRAYPAAFRARHGREMRLIFAAEWAAARAHGTRGRIGCLRPFLGDLVRTVPHERLAALTLADGLAAYTALGCGGAAAWVQAHANDPWSTPLVLFIGSAFFAFFAARRTWRWPCVVALLLFAGHVHGAVALGMPFVGAFAGARLRRRTTLPDCVRD